MLHRDYGPEVRIRLGIYVVPVCYSYFMTQKYHWKDSNIVSYPIMLGIYGVLGLGFDFGSLFSQQPMNSYD
jgi:hypothetical protein